MHLNERAVLTGAILFGLGLVAGIAIGSATAVSALTQGAPDVLQSWSGVVAMPLRSSGQSKRSRLVHRAAVVIVLIRGAQFEIEKQS